MKKIIAHFLILCVMFQSLTLTALAETSITKNTTRDYKTMQSDNSNPLENLEVNKTGYIGSGVTYLCSREVINNSPEQTLKMHSPQFAIDGDKSTYYFSGLYYNNPTPEGDYIQVELPKNQTIYQVNLIPIPGGISFPIDVEIQTSLDGKTWTSVATQTDMNPTTQSTIEIVFSSAKIAKYVRVISKKLKAQSDGVSYYAQYAEIQIINTSDENVALTSKGAVASASNSLYGDKFDYETFFSDTIDTGVNWVNITNEFAYSNYQNNLSIEPLDTEIANFKKLKDNNINILYRFTNAPSFEEIIQDKDAAAERFAASMMPRVEALKDYVDVWGIFGEINVRDNKYAADYAYVIKKVISAIKEIDPTAQFNFATALIDYGWTAAMLDAGLDEYIDIIGIHIYKDIYPTLSYPEITGNIIKNGAEIRDTEHVDYEAQINEYKKLVASYSPDIKIMVTEVSEPGDLLPDADGENIIQAKWLTRQYAVDKGLELDGTFWFTVDPISAPRIISTLVDTEGNRTPAWYALQNYNTVFRGTNSKSLCTSVDITGDTDNLKYNIYENGDEYIIPYWYAVAFTDDFAAGTIDIDLSNFNGAEVTAVDLLTGKTQKINVENGIAHDLIVRDYVSVLKIKKSKKSGNVWNEVSEACGLGMDWNGHDERTQMTLSNDYTSDGNGAAKVEWVGSSDDGSDAQIGISSNKIPQISGAAVKAVTMDVYVPQTIDDEVNGAVGSSLAGYVKTSDNKYLNGDGTEERILSAGWNRIIFDAVNGVEMPFFIWKNSNKSGTIYIDDIRIEYQYPNEVFDSFENYEDDWTKGNWTLSKNTDPAYVKDGNASMKIECSSTGEAYGFKSKFLYLDGVNGKLVPKIEGYTPKTFGFWVYSDGAAAQFKPEGTEDWRQINSEGWTYIEWNIPSASVNWWDWDINHFNQMIMKVTQSGNLYIDAMTIGYHNDRMQILDFSIVNESGNNDINAGDTIKVSTSIDKNDDSEYPFVLLAALYDKDENLIAVNVNQFEIGGQETGIFSKSVNVRSENTAAVTARGFLWDNIKLVRPYVKEITMRSEKN